MNNIDEQRRWDQSQRRVERTEITLKVLCIRAVFRIIACAHAVMCLL